MRRLAKRSTAVTISAIAALFAALSLSASASAAAPTFEGTFACSATSKCGSTESWTPGRLAVNETTGDVYVLDTENDAIQVFDEDGVFKSTIKGADMEGGSFGFGGDDDIAIDNSGTSTQGRIYVNAGFSSFFGFDADVSAATAVVSSKWKAAGVSQPCGVAVDPVGNFYGSDYGGGVQERNPATGALEGSPIVKSSDAGDTCHIAFDSAANLYLHRWDTNAVSKLLAPTYVFPGTTINPASNSDIEVNRANDRSYVVGSTVIIRFYEANGSESSGSPFDSGAAGRSYLGATPNSQNGRLYVSDSNNDKVEIWDPPIYSLTITKTGAAASAGQVQCKVNGGPAGACVADYPEGTTVELVATPGPNSVFAGFSNGCIGTTCNLTIGANTTVSAKFELESHDLTVKATGAGSGSVTCNGKACAAAYVHGSILTLKATPNSGSKFDGWSGGGCSGTGECKVTVGADTEVTASFSVVPQEQPKEEPKADPPSNPPTGNPPVVNPPADDSAALGQCVANANKAAQKARKAASKKKGKAKAKALNAANKRKAKAIQACKAQFS